MHSIIDPHTGHVICEAETEAKVREETYEYLLDKVRGQDDYRAYTHEFDLILEYPDETRKEITMEIFV